MKFSDLIDKRIRELLEKKPQMIRKLVPSYIDSKVTCFQQWRPNGVAPSVWPGSSDILIGSLDFLRGLYLVFLHIDSILWPTSLNVSHLLNSSILSLGWMYLIFLSFNLPCLVTDFILSYWFNIVF
jgi:hypothetical protein